MMSIGKFLEFLFIATSPVRVQLWCYAFIQIIHCKMSDQKVSRKFSTPSLFFKGKFKFMIRRIHKTTEIYCTMLHHSVSTNNFLSFKHCATRAVNKFHCRFFTVFIRPVSDREKKYLIFHNFGANVRLLTFRVTIYFSLLMIQSFWFTIFIYHNFYIVNICSSWSWATISRQLSKQRSLRCDKLYAIKFFVCVYFFAPMASANQIIKIRNLLMLLPLKYLSVVPQFATP